MFKLSQETIAIVTVGLALAGLEITGDLRTRAETQAVREEGRAERQAIREEGRADREALRAEARADREGFEKHIEALRAKDSADREDFERHIVRLTREQGRIDGIVEQMRTAGR